VDWPMITCELDSSTSLVISFWLLLIAFFVTK
jgi:hypothetical protein